jgi:hypothetical protein
MTVYRHPVADWFLSASSMCVLVALLAAIDDRVRTFFSTTIPSTSADDLAAIAGRVHSIIAGALHSAHLQAGDHMTLVVFGVASFGLVIVMLKT